MTQQTDPPAPGEVSQWIVFYSWLDPLQGEPMMDQKRLVLSGTQAQLHSIVKIRSYLSRLVPPAELISAHRTHCPVCGLDLEAIDLPDHHNTPGTSRRCPYDWTREQ